MTTIGHTRPAVDQTAHAYGQTIPLTGAAEPSLHLNPPTPEKAKPITTSNPLCIQRLHSCLSSCFLQPDAQIEAALSSRFSANLEL